MVNNNQHNLSEQLQLLYELQYSDLDMPYQAAKIHSNKQSRHLDANRDVRLLDTIAIALTTGNPGDVFAAAFDKRQNIQLVLAKNGPPTHEDVTAANELISLIASPTVAGAMDLFPFLIRRCGANIDKWIHNLHTSIRDAELHNDFMLAMQAYVPEADIRVEFPGADKFLGDHGDVLPPFAAVWGDFVGMITDRTVQGLDAQDVPSSIQKYAELFLLADVLRRSCFLKKLIDDRNLLHGSQGEGREAEAAFAQGLPICQQCLAPYPESQEVLPDSAPLGHGHFRWHGSVCIRPLR